MRLALTPPSGFSFLRTVRSHGWCYLAPFRVSDAFDVLSTTVTLPTGQTCAIELRAASVTAHGAEASDRTSIRAIAERILGFDIDLAPLYARLAGDPRRAWAAECWAGRMLRAPSLWEDLVKMILTTNCSWRLTEVMVERLVGELGGGAFPPPHAMAERDERFYRDVIRAGYRSPSLVALARDVAGGAIDLDALVARDRPTRDVRAAIMSLPGCGPYVAENILRLLGRSDFLGLDSWSRAVYAKRVHNDGRGTARRLKDSTIERAYKKWGEYAGLVFWLDVTRHWHDGEESTWP